MWLMQFLRDLRVPTGTRPVVGSDRGHHALRVAGVICRPVAAELVCAAEHFCETARLLHSLIRLFVLDDSEASLRKGQ